MRVLGVDPGLTRCGIGVVDGAAGRPLRMAAVGVVRTPGDSPIAERLLLIEQGVEEWLTEHRPEVVAIERVFSQHNVRTVMGTAQASAVAMLCASRRGLPVALHTPSEVKAAVTGNGRAGKAQVGAMVTRLLRLDAPPKPADAADALALAICHIWRAPAQDRLTQARTAASQRTASARARAAATRSAWGVAGDAGRGAGSRAPVGGSRAVREAAPGAPPARTPTTSQAHSSGRPPRPGRADTPPGGAQP